MKNKKEAAEFLGVSERAIERYTAKGKLNPKYEKAQGGGQIAYFDEKELKALKSQMEQPKAAPSPVKRIPQQEDKQKTDTALTLRASAPNLAQMFAAAFQAYKETEQGSVAVTDKLTLALDEASILAGLSKSYLVADIHAKKLKAAKRGRGWNIKRADLDAYISKL
jgi:excisionase family DNA binding protein